MVAPSERNTESPDTRQVAADEWNSRRIDARLRPAWLQPDWMATGRRGRSGGVGADRAAAARRRGAPRHPLALHCTGCAESIIHRNVADQDGRRRVRSGPSMGPRTGAGVLGRTVGRQAAGVRLSGRVGPDPPLVQRRRRAISDIGAGRRHSAHCSRRPRPVRRLAEGAGEGSIRHWPKMSGGRVYRTHAAGFMMIRHGCRHTWDDRDGSDDALLARADRVWPGFRLGRHRDSGHVAHPGLTPDVTPCSP